MAFFSRKLLFLPLIAPLAGCGSPGLPAKATVMTIDHECTIVTKYDPSMGASEANGIKVAPVELDQRKGECKSVDEWQEVRKKRSKDVDGTAAVHVEYQAPQDGSYRTGTLNFTGRDDEFYELKAGDTIDILVAEDDPARIRKG
jgi:hypothetical protein